MDERGVGNGWLLPAGPLREKWPRTVDLLLHTGTSNLSGGFQAKRQLGETAHDAQGRTIALSSLKINPVDAVAGLARPEAFFNMLRATGLELTNASALPDHDDFATWPTTANQRPLLCTEKDAAKLWQRQPAAWAVPLVLTPEPAFWHALDALLAKTTPHS
jgi:tetraacyldisaccharide 4'-kinase